MPVPKGRAGVKAEMEKYKMGNLHSGSKSGPVVTNRKQAIAISLSEAGMSKEMPKGMKAAHLKTHHPKLHSAYHGKK